MNNIININPKEQSHGYQDVYYYNKLSYRGKYINGNRIGYAEYHGSKRTRYYIK